MLTLNHIGQYKDIALLMARYALWDFKLRADPSQPLDDPDPRKPLEADRTERAQAFARHLKEMGPTFVKFGQLLSTRPDIVPPEYIAALERFQDDLDPFPYSEVESTIKQELGESPGKLFRHFSREPLAAASLGQVHRATLKNGRDVAVKIQRPGVREAVEEDLKVIREIAETLEARTEMGRKMNLSEMAKQFRTTMQSELDYRQEARNAAVLSHNLTEFPHIRIPEVFEDYTNTRVLTTEMVHGTKISRLKRVPSGGPRLAASLMHAYLKQVGVDGFWHCDPHPGNLFVRGNELFLIDLGMVANISQELQSQLMRLLLSLTENRGEEVAGIAIELGRPLDGFDPDRFTREIAHATAHFHGMDFRHTNSGRFLFQVIALSAQHNLQIPAEVGLLAKTLLHLDGAVKALDPDFDPVSATRHYSAKLIAQKIRRQLQPRNFYTAIIELIQLTLEVPGRARDFMEQLASGRTGLTLKLSQAEDLLRGMHRIANRITAGLISASLIVSSSIVLQIAGPGAVSGYTILALSGYVIAAVLGVYLLLSTLVRDSGDEKRAKVKSR